MNLPNLQTNYHAANEKVVPKLRPRRGTQEKHTRDGTRTHNLLLRREAPYPLGHKSLKTDFERTS